MMLSKSIVSVDEISNDSGFSSGISRDSSLLDVNGYNNCNDMEKGNVNVSLTAEDFEDNTVSDTLNTAFICPKKPGRSISPNLLLTKKGGCKIRKSILGKRKGRSLENNEEINESKGGEDLCRQVKRSKMSLAFSPVKLPSINLVKGEAENEVYFKLPIIGTPQLPSTDFDGTYKKEIQVKDAEEPVKKSNIESTSLKFVGDVKCDKLNNKSSNLFATSNLSTSFKFDSDFVKKKRILGKRRISSEDVNGESPKIKKKCGDGSNLGKDFESSKISPTISCTLTPSNINHCEEKLEVVVKYGLPLVPLPQKESTAFGSISGETLVNLINEHGEDFNNKYILIDCRYPYEYEGGHIKGAINLYDSDRLCGLFFPENKDGTDDIKNKIPIFYCEFSQKRGPGMALSLRSIDRKMNVYPDVSYKELYVLDRGYKKFFTDDKYHEYCEPSGYIPMNQKNFTGELKKHKHRHQSERTRVGRILSRERSTRIRSLEFKRRVIDFNNLD